MRFLESLLLSSFIMACFYQTAFCSQNEHFIESDKKAGRVLYLTASNEYFVNDIKKVSEYIINQIASGKKPTEIMIIKPESVKDFKNPITGERQTCSKMVVHFVYIYYHQIGFSVIFGDKKVAPDGLGQSITCQQFFEDCATDM